MPEQNFKNHARFVPIFHVGVTVPLLINLGWSIWQLIHQPSGSTVVSLILAVGLFLLAFSARTMALTVQDRVIRLESRLRMQQLLNEELLDQAMALPIKHVVALRFAGDEEFPELVRETVAGRLTTPKDIKMRVKNWQSDFLRA